MIMILEKFFFTIGLFEVKNYAARYGISAKDTI